MSNLPTVWTNVLAGMVASGAGLDRLALVRTAFGVSLMYCGGMFLNDAFDADVDRRHRPDRPIPAGDVTRTEVFAAGGAMMVAGQFALFLVAPVQLWASLLVLAIVVYDVAHKRTRAAVLVMGACRGLVYMVAAASATAMVLPPGPIVAVALLMTAYVVALTGVARIVGQRAGVVVPVLIAGISIVDAAAILATGGSVTRALVAVAGFALTLALQRVVPGT